jgi:PAS domain S-box-containing protein
MIRDPFAHTNLSDQETAVLRLAADGLTDREIAGRMAVSEKTVDTYWSRIRQKLVARNRTHAVAIAYKGAYEDRLDPLYGCDSMLADCEEGVWIIDLRGNTIYANQKLADMFGFTLDEMQKVNGWDLLDEEGRAEAKRMAEEFPTGRRDTFRFRFKKKDGSDLCVVMTTSPIMDDSGKQIRSLAMLNDITNEALAG